MEGHKKSKPFTNFTDSNQKLLRHYQHSKNIGRLVYQFGRSNSGSQITF